MLCGNSVCILEYPYWTKSIDSYVVVKIFFVHKNGVFGIRKVDDIDIGDFKLLANRSCNEIVVMEVDCLVSCRSIKCLGQSGALNILHKILLRHLCLHITFACSVQGTNLCSSNFLNFNYHILHNTIIY